MSSPGTLAAIWLKSAHRGPMLERDRVRVDAGQGLEDNAHRGGRRQITLLDLDHWERVERSLGDEIEPVVRRANLHVRGLDLRESRDRVLRVGSCRIRIGGETKPCRLLDDAFPGLEDALRPDWGGGAYGVALDDGEIAAGDPVAWVETSDG